MDLQESSFVNIIIDPELKGKVHKVHIDNLFAFDSVSFTYYKIFLIKNLKK